jgi:hypothetical protein
MAIKCIYIKEPRQPAHSIAALKQRFSPLSLTLTNATHHHSSPFNAIFFIGGILAGPIFTILTPPPVGVSG